MMSFTRSAVTTSARNVAGHRGPPKDSLRERLGGMERAFTPNQWPEGRLRQRRMVTARVIAARRGVKYARRCDHVGHIMWPSLGDLSMLAQREANDLKKIKHIVKLRSDVRDTSCEECDKWWGAGHGSSYPIADHANHYVQDHGYRILHIGQETTHDDSGTPSHSTVFILGTDRSNAERLRQQREKSFEMVREQMRVALTVRKE